MGHQKKSLNLIILGLLIISTALAAVLFIIGLFYPQFADNPSYRMVLYACGVIFIPNIVAFVLNRKNFYYSAAVILVSSLILLSLFADTPAKFLEGQNILLAIPIFLASILFFPSSSWIVFGIVAIGKFLIDGSSNYINSIEIVGVSAFVALIAWVTAYSRQRLERVLKTREGSHKLLFDSSSNPILIRKMDGTMIDANDAACAFLGYSFEEITKINAKTWYVSDEEWQRVSKEIMHQTANQSIYSVITTYIPKNGEKVRVNLTGTVLKRNGETIYQSIIQPLDSKEMEVELRASQTKYKTLIDSIDGVVWESDTHYQFTFVSAQAEKIFGYPVRDWINNPDFLVSHIHSEDKERVIAECIEMTRQKKDHELEYRMISASGQSIWVRDLVSIVIENGEVTGLRGILVDISARKEAEILRSQVQSMLQLQMDKMPIACIVWNTNYTVNSWNPMAEKIFGWTAAEAIGSTVEDLCLITDTDTPVINGIWDRLIHGDETANSENWNLTKDGNAVLCRWTNVPLNKDGVTYGALSMVEDITAQKIAEDDIKTSEHRYRSLFENMINGFAYCKMTETNGKLDFTYLSTNKAFEQLTGLKNVDGHNASEVIPGIQETDMELLEKYNEVSVTCEPIKLETFVHALQDWYEVSVYCPEPGYFVAVFDVVTQRKETENRIADLARFPEENPNPVERIRPDGTFLYSNEAAKHLMSDFASKNGKIPEENMPLIRKVWESGRPYETEMVIKDKTISLYIVPVQLANYINIYGKDVTNEKILTEKLNQSQKMEAIGRLAGGVAHDFNNLLTVIGGYADITIDKINSDSIDVEEIKNGIEQIRVASKRAGTVTAQLLSFARRQILQMKIVDLNASVVNSKKMLSNFIGEDIEIKTFLDENLGKIKADPSQIEQIILNMCINSKDAMPKGGIITIETTNKDIDEEYVKQHPGMLAGNYICLAISDTGHGMSKEVLSQIFEPFFTTKPKGKGTGLGLSMVYGIVKQSGGSIYCYSEAGKGTTFKIFLPRTAGEIPEEEKITPVDETAGTETILLVEDDATVRGLAKMFLVKAGYHILEATSGTDAIDVAKNNEGIHMLITDVIMPHMNGKELAVAISKIHPKIKILFISGYTDNTIVHQGILEDGVNFLQKPFSNKELLRKVRSVLDNGG
jgi:PAS domain S-box-containing protein